MRAKSKGNHSKYKADTKSNGKSKSKSNKTKSGEARKDKATDKVQVPKSEKDRRMKDGECVKCGKAGHIGKDCRTGWKYDAASAIATESKTVTTIEKKRPASTQSNQSNQQNQQKRSKLIDQPDGSIKTIASRIEELSDSGND